MAWYRGRVIIILKEEEIEAKDNDDLISFLVKIITLLYKRTL